ncbi:MAG: hypothetical protein AB8I08_14755 [Sandaracinaceae bacterium]
MGTDIRAFVELDTEGPRAGTRCFAELSFGRDYVMFDLLFAVRGEPEDGKPASARPGRGFPSRVSPVLARVSEGWPADQSAGADEHGVGWLDASEVVRFHERVLATGHRSSELAAIAAMMTKLAPDEPSRCRLVFWFNS